MANKRNIKKAIKLACGTIACQCINAEDLFGGDESKWSEIIVDALLLQENSLARVASLRFTDKPGEYANGREYRKARRAYFKAAIKSLSDFMSAEAAKIADKMNELMPEKA